MATFVKILNKEDISTMDNRDNIREVRNPLHPICPALENILVIETVNFLLSGRHQPDNWAIKYLPELFWQPAATNQ